MSLSPADIPRMESHLLKAMSIAQRVASADIATTHLEVDAVLLGLVQEPGGEAGRCLRSLGVTAAALAQELGVQINTTNAFRGYPLSEEVGSALERAADLAVASGEHQITTKHMLVALLKDHRGACAQLLATFGITTDQVFVALGLQTASPAKEITAPSEAVDLPAVPSIVEKYCVDLTMRAAEGKLDPIIGRDDEINRVVEVIHRRLKGNPMLVGEAGVGKTAIVEGVAQQLLESNDPDINSIRIVSLDLASLAAGTKFRGELEARMKKLLQVLGANPNIMLFIDELHNLIATRVDGTGIGDMLKPALSRGRLRCIGATTPKGHREMMKDEALARRFQPVRIEPPSREKTLSILKGIRGIYENHHGVSITDDTLEAAVDWSARYVHNRVWPDSAIDLIEDGSAILNSERSKSHSESIVVERRHLARAIAVQTGIPAPDILNQGESRLLDLEDELHQMIIGQDEAISEVSRAIRRSRSGLRDERRPIASFMFLGPTGVGKTQVAKALAKRMFQDEGAIIRMDMSEFDTPQSIGRLLGSPPGYIGYDDKGGQLTEAIRRRPYSIVLFDEIEKAHPLVNNILLQMLDNGTITDATGRKADTSHIIFIATSNVGHGIGAERSIGFFTPSQQKEMNASWRRAAENTFPVELLNRFDALVPFHALNLEHCNAIASIYLSELRERLEREHKLHLEVQPSSLEKIVADSVSPEYGARELRRAMEQKVEHPIAHFILTNKVDPGCTLLCDPLSENPITVEEPVPSIGF